ncbi:phospho-sugar mutase [Corynebacterium deserti]|nr:phospho-sugar mutase [Corynebacterium deserti]
MDRSRNLSFGTAGLRAPVGPARHQMNVLQVTRTTAGVASWLADRAAKDPVPHLVPEDETGIGRALYPQDGPLRVVVGYDARYGSHTFAATTAEVFAGAGFEVTLLPTPSPTPMIPWLVKKHGLDAGVQITASHNGAADNGYKVFLANGRQLYAELEAELEAHINAVEDPITVPRVTVRPTTDQLRRYVDELVDLVTPDQADLLRVNSERGNLRVVYTAMHGVGGRAMSNAFQFAGFPHTHGVKAQQYPDPTFPTVPFPNPEEPSAIELLLERAAEKDADVLFALDPDADRCAVGIRTPDGGHRMLSGDEMGTLLATRLVPPYRGEGVRPVVATTVVSSQLLSIIAEDKGWDYSETLTGFKNLSRAADDHAGPLTFAYEEAVGICPAPDLVPDKDGISTALFVAAWAAELKAHGAGLQQKLDELYRQYGYFASSQIAVRTTSPRELVDAWSSHPPAELIGVSLTPVALPENQGVALYGRVGPVHIRAIARVSGTEAKAKMYLEVGQSSSHDEARELLKKLEVDVTNWLEQL